MRRLKMLCLAVLVLTTLLWAVACAPATTTSKLPGSSSSSGTSSSSTLPGQESAALFINEICIKNETVHPDPFGIYYDYIELYNASETEVSLAGYAITDDIEATQPHTFSSLKVPAGGYVVLYACGDKVAPSMTEQTYLPFKLSAGETVTLLAPDGTVADSITAPALAPDTAYGRTANGSALLAKLNPTPEADNANSVIALADANLVFSAESGFYDEDFLLTMQVPQGCEIYYTVNDCEDPTTAASAKKYTAPVSITGQARANFFSNKQVTNGSMYHPVGLIDKATVIRAIVRDSEGHISDVFTRVYFVGYADKDGYDNLSVVSIVSTPENLYDSSKGIFVNGNWSGKGREYERQATFTYFDENGNFGFTQEIGIRIQGSSTRAYQQKSMSLFARDEYDGNNRFIDPIFDGVSEVKSMVLRYDRNHKFNEGFLMKLVEDREIDVADYKPCVVFLEGEYYGIYNLYVRTSEHELAEKYGVEKDDVTIIKKSKLEQGTQADLNDYNAFIQYAKTHDLSNPAYYAEICRMMDMQSYIDYLCAQIYYCNVDWSAWQNIACWKTRVIDPTNPYADGRWRWILYDLDFCIGYSNSSYDQDTNAFTVVMPYTKTAAFSESNNPLTYALLANATFCEQFVTTFTDMANVNFNPERTNALLASLIDTYAPNMPKHFHRFDGYASDGSVRDEAHYRSRTAKFFTYFEKRFDYAMAHLKEQFGLKSSLTPLTLSVEGADGTLRLNTTTPPLKEGQTTLYYYTDYALTVTAQAPEGYTFVGWQVDGVTLADGCSLSDATITFTITGSTPSLCAIFSAV